MSNFLLAFLLQPCYFQHAAAAPSTASSRRRRARGARSHSLSVLPVVLVLSRGRKPPPRKSQKPWGWIVSRAVAGVSPHPPPPPAPTACRHLAHIASKDYKGTGTLRTIKPAWLPLRLRNPLTRSTTITMLRLLCYYARRQATSYLVCYAYAYLFAYGRPKMRPRFNSNIFSKTRKDGDTSLIIVNTSFWLQQQHLTHSPSTARHKPQPQHNNPSRHADRNENLICLLQSLVWTRFTFARIRFSSTFWVNNEFA